MSDLNGITVAFLQYGNFAVAEQHLAATGTETFHSQNYSVGYVQNLVQRGAEVIVIDLSSPPDRDEILASGVRNIGIEDPYSLSYGRWASRLDSLKIDRLILRTPLPAALKWAKASRTRSIGVLADTFAAQNIRQRLSLHRLKRLLRGAGLEFVGNHGHAASRQLVDIGIDPALVVPWDWPQPDTPARYSTKRLPQDRPPRLLYVGAISEAKGVFDALRGFVTHLDRGGDGIFHIIGPDKDGLLAQWRDQSSHAERIVVHGQQPRAFVQEMMAASDLVIVPSRHAYSEGMPKAIYDALCVRTPLVVSDHPVFTANLIHGESAMIFPEGQAGAIADAIGAALQPGTYGCLSQGGLNAWNRMQIETKWLDLVDAWLTGDNDWWRGRSYGTSPLR